jgi:hypothetical protein
MYARAQEWEYHLPVRRRIRASVAGFALLGLWFLSATAAPGQINGTPPSVTSIGFGGHFDRPPGIPPSVTSLGPEGFTPNHQFFAPSNCCFKGAVAPGANRLHFEHHPHHTPIFPIGGVIYPVPYPVYMANPQDEEPGPAMAPEPYSAGPTIFDRRASGQTSQSVEAGYAERVRDDRALTVAAPPPASAASVEAAPVIDQPPTALIFKDGRHLEVENYAIVGTMLYDLTPGHRSKIPISDLDLAATVKQNDERGIDFQLPAKPEKN